MPLIFSNSYDSNNTAKIESHRRSVCATNRRSVHSPLSTTSNGSTHRNLYSSADFTSTTEIRSTPSRSNGIRVSHRTPAPLTNKNENQLNRESSNGTTSNGVSNSISQVTKTTISSTNKMRRSGSVNTSLSQSQSNANGNTSTSSVKGKSSSIKIKSRKQQEAQAQVEETNNLNLINPNSSNFVESMLQSYYQDTYLNQAALSASLNAQNPAQQSQFLASFSVMSLIAQYDNTENCQCYLCQQNTNDKRNLVINNYEVIPSLTSNNDNDYTIMRFQYSKPFSQLSCLKLFNLMNTDCSIYYCNDKPTISTFERGDSDSKSVVDESILSNNSVLDTPSLLNFTTNPINTQLINSEYKSNVNNSNNNTNNKPPLYDTHYLYLIDCRFDRKDFESSHLNTAIYYEDLLKDAVYLSPPVEHYTIVVLYDEDGTYLTSNDDYRKQDSNRRPQSRRNGQHHQQQNHHKQSSDALISTIKEKLNHTGTLYILSGGYQQFRANYPFMCSNLDIRSTVDRYKYLTIYPNCVLENFMFLGTGAQAKNWKIIRDLRITHIINSSIEHECMFMDTVKYLHIKLEDSLEENIYRELDRSYEFIQDAINSYVNDNTTKYPPRILIHCNLGISRSSSILIAYLIRKYKLCLFSTFNYVRDKRIQIAPNYSFLKQLKYYENNL